MTTTKKLYRVVREHCYYGGGNHRQVHRTEVLYCGYDRDEARRVLYLHQPEDRGGTPGSHGCDTICQSKVCNDDE